MKGYMGKLLRVDLTTAPITEETLDPQLARDYIGGAGLGIRLAYDEIPPSIDPLGPEAKLLIMTGPGDGNGAGRHAGRFEVVFKSPLTGILRDASSGGFRGSDLKLAGYDGLILQGAARRRSTSISWTDTLNRRRGAPVGHRCLRRAGRPAGRSGRRQGPARLGHRAGRQREVLNVLHGQRRRADAGPRRQGAVMGHMKLKAIVVRGYRSRDLAEPAAFREYAVGVNKPTPHRPRSRGCACWAPRHVMDNNWPLSDIPTKNFSLGSQEAMCVNLGGKRCRQPSWCRTSPVTGAAWAVVLGTCARRPLHHGRARVPSSRRWVRWARTA